MREVILKLTTQKDLIKHQSDARTFGELKKELPNVKWSGMRVVERSNKATLQMANAVLPQGDFILFLVPEKVKSGIKKDGGLKKLPKEINDCSYNECRSHISWLNREKDAKLNVSGSAADLQKRLKKYYKKTGNAIESVKESAKEIASPPKSSGMTDIALVIEDSRGRINTAIDTIIEKAALIEQEGYGVDVQPPLQYTLEDLEKEIEIIRKALKTPAYTRVE